MSKSKALAMKAISNGFHSKNIVLDGENRGFEGFWCPRYPSLKRFEQHIKISSSKGSFKTNKVVILMISFVFFREISQTT